jgi:hypothetical protein
VTDWTPVFLGIIALSVLVMAAIQVGAIVYGARLARRVNALTGRMEREMAPVFAHLQTLSAEAARASALAAQQVERADRLFADVSVRLEDTVATIQSAVVTPAREGLAVIAGLKAALGALRDLRPQAAGRASRHARGDDEDPLFIG